MAEAALYNLSELVYVGWVKRKPSAIRRWLRGRYEVLPYHVERRNCVSPAHPRYNRRAG